MYMLSRSAEYALRIMAFIALQESSSPLRAKDLSKNTDIPLPYLSKILRRMVVGKLLAAVKGHRGGFTLCRDPKRVRFADILEAVEGGPTAALCAFGWDQCSDKTPCILHHRWKQARDSFQLWARQTTLADIKEDCKDLDAFFSENIQFRSLKARCNPKTPTTSK